MSTKPIPTDRNGNVYYGPKTTKEARSVIEAEFDPNESDPHPAHEVANWMERAGYEIAAARIRREYGIEESND